MPGEYKGRDSAEWRELFFDYRVSFARTFYFDNVFPLLKSASFYACVYVQRFWNKIWLFGWEC